jgi:NAD(P)-dependent dehydrogenase (short-subunit alcohol dehydrogenase family)
MVKMATRNAPTGELAGKVAVVTGAAPGVGRAAALALARVGAHIAGIDIAARVSMILDVAPSTPRFGNSRPKPHPATSPP